ncbi:DNA polymerase subunit gamma-2, mitochondrial [Biomphalaria glabrata]|nr:DNA polymerase subunit gamma-2, mitochondrial [Biomphalaria glabrata]
MTSTVKNYANLMPMLKKRGFINIIQNQDTFLNDYGPAGTLLRHNILKQWWDTMVNQQSNVFPMENNLAVALKQADVGQGDVSCIERNNNTYQELLMPDYKSKYLQVLKLTNYRLPFSITSVRSTLSTRTPAMTSEIQSQSDLKAFLLGDCNRTRLLLQNFILPSSRNKTFDFWLHLRLSWWKNFSNKPADFHVSSENSKNSQTGSNENGTENGMSPKCINIVYHFPWGMETIEKVHSLGDQPFQDPSNVEQEKYKGLVTGKEPSLPHCIVCDTNLETATAALLVDSYYERRMTSTDSTTRPSMVLKLHSQISPFQIAIAVSNTSTRPSELRHVCHHLEKDFKRNGVSLFNISEQGSTLEAHFKRNDQLGIHYTIIVSDSTISEGLISTRHRDTQIQVWLYVKDIPSS